LASILRTAQQRHLDADAVITTLLHAPTPIVSPQFYPASASVNSPGNQILIIHCATSAKRRPKMRRKIITIPT
jgi:hypothetical protein